MKKHPQLERQKANNYSSKKRQELMARAMQLIKQPSNEQGRKQLKDRLAKMPGYRLASMVYELESGEPT
jgi:hypothetical protein